MHHRVKGIAKKKMTKTYDWYSRSQTTRPRLDSKYFKPFLPDDLTQKHKYHLNQVWVHFNKVLFIKIGSRPNLAHRL